MATFQDIVAGPYARRRVLLPLGDGGADKAVDVDIRILTTAEEAKAREGAMRFAREHGADKDAEETQVFQLGLWAHTLAIACIDPDSPEDAPALFFTGGAAEILNTRLLTREHLAYLYAHHEAWQDECAPYERDVNDGEILVRAAKIAAGDARPFVDLPPVMRWRFLRSMAVLLCNSLAASSRSSSTSPETSPALPS